ncbi:hypothetical protein [Effusibacillus pohliae]|uniref:hypothetical protein n=1 Tax=Effusibacillus pohliae TaxID=232270 RepID=UPI00037789AF|nr:hypothetical protein [Effusibacillus pohliae]
MKARHYLLLAAIAIVTAGCQPLNASMPNFWKQTAAQQPAAKATFQDVIDHTQANPLKGKVLAEMNGPFDPGLPRYAFVTTDGRPVFVYQETDGTVRLAVEAKDGTVKRDVFPGYKLQKALLNGKILYIAGKDKLAVKYNVDSFNYSEVDKSEMDQLRGELDIYKLPGKEKAIHMNEGFIYTQEGFIFDVKNHEYLRSGTQKQKFYEYADVGYGSYLFEIQPRLDQAVNLKAVRAKGDKTAKGGSYPIFLDLPSGYNVKYLDHAMGDDGQLFLFAMGAQENNKLVIKLFEIPLGDFQEP